MGFEIVLNQVHASPAGVGTGGEFGARLAMLAQQGEQGDATCFLGMEGFLAFTHHEDGAAQQCLAASVMDQRCTEVPRGADDDRRVQPRTQSGGVDVDNGVAEARPWASAAIVRLIGIE